MTRILIAVMGLAVLPLAARAGETVVRLDVRPMAAPKPALKYLLLPEVRELKPGNPAQYYLRCFAEQRNFFFSKGGTQQRADYLAMPLAELAAKKIRNYGGGALTQADWAARLTAIDWEKIPRVQMEGMEQRLPELDPLRILATALRVRFRIEVAGRHFELAVRTAKTMFALARHLGEYPAEEANLAGLFVAGLAVDALQEMVQQPDCPNLYWAFADLPCPLVDLRKGFQGGGTLTAMELQPILEDAVMTAEQLEKAVSRLSGVMAFKREQAGRAPRSLRVRLAARAKDADRVRRVRDRLLEAQRAEGTGRVSGKESLGDFLNRLMEMNSAKSRIEKFTPLQVILLDEKHKYEIQRDERMRLLGLAPWQIDAIAKAKGQRSEDGLFADFLPRIIPVRRKQAGLEQRLALLRHVEALRLYAAGHGGKLPEKLSEISVPLPVDPFNGKPFAYKKEGTIAQLQGTNVRYEINIRR